MSKYQPRYIAYCKAHNTTPEEDSQRPHVAFRFMMWTGRRVEEFRRERGLGRWDHLPEHELDAWLDERAEELARG